MISKAGLTTTALDAGALLNVLARNGPIWAPRGKDSSWVVYAVTGLATDKDRYVYYVDAHTGTTQRQTLKAFAAEVQNIIYFLR